MQLTSVWVLFATLAHSAAECDSWPGRTNANKVVGLNAWPGDIGLRFKNRGCEDWCSMHELDGDARLEKDAALAQTAIAGSDFLVVDGWRGFMEPHYRFVGVDELMGGDRDGKITRVEPGKLTVSSNMDPYDLAGRRLFDMAPFLNITIAYSMKASVPTTFAEPGFWDEVAALPTPSFGSKEGFLVWVSSNCRPGATYGRDKVVEAMMGAAADEPFKLHSRGGCMNNAPRFPGNYGNGLQEGYSTYKFALVMENSVEIDWVTEKFFLPFQANTVPVYYGAPNIAKYAPGPNSFINMRDFDSPGALLERLRFLAEHEDEYLKYFEWRKTQTRVPPSLARVQRASMHRDDVACDVCACACDRECRAGSAKRLLEYPHIPQLTPWDAPTQAEIDSGKQGYFVPCSAGGCDGAETAQSTRAPSASDLWGSGGEGREEL
eukprot:g392.t1